MKFLQKLVPWTLFPHLPRGTGEVLMQVLPGALHRAWCVPALGESALPWARVTRKRTSSGEAGGWRWTASCPGLMEAKAEHRWGHVGPGSWSRERSRIGSPRRESLGHPPGPKNLIRNFSLPVPHSPTPPLPTPPLRAWGTGLWWGGRRKEDSWVQKDCRLTVEHQGVRRAGTGTREPLQHCCRACTGQISPQATKYKETTRD